MCLLPAFSWLARGCPLERLPASGLGLQPSNVAPPPAHPACGWRPGARSHRPCAADQASEGKLGLSGYSGCRPVRPSDRVIIAPFVPGPPGTSLGPFPMTAPTSLVRSAILCPRGWEPKPYLHHLASSACGQFVWVSLRLAYAQTLVSTVDVVWPKQSSVGLSPASFYILCFY